MDNFPLLTLITFLPLVGAVVGAMTTSRLLFSQNRDVVIAPTIG